MALVKPLLNLHPAVLLVTNAMIFAHNHPSGDLEPSPADKKLAKTRCAACTLLGLRLLEPHLDRGRKHELRAVRAVKRGCAMKNLRHAPLFEHSELARSGDEPLHARGLPVCGEATL